jgi:hypothetical protein
VANQSKKNDRTARHVREFQQHSPSLVHHLTSQHMSLHRLCTTSTSDTVATALLHRSQHAAAACQARSSAPPPRRAHHARAYTHTHAIHCTQARAIHCTRHTPHASTGNTPHARKRETSRTSKSAPKKIMGGESKKKSSKRLTRRSA